MYDYISIQSDPEHSQSITIEEFKLIFSEFDYCISKSNASYTFKIGQFELNIQGVKSDSDGNYAFNDDSHFIDINLIEINIPQGAESKIDAEIREFAVLVASRINWKIDWRE